MFNKTKFPWPKLPSKLLFSKLKRYNPSQINNNNTALFFILLGKIYKCTLGDFFLAGGRFAPHHQQEKYLLRPRHFEIFSAATSRTQKKGAPNHPKSAGEAGK